MCYIVIHQRKSINVFINYIQDLSIQNDREPTEPNCYIIIPDASASAFDVLEQILSQHNCYAIHWVVGVRYTMGRYTIYENLSMVE